MGRKTLWLSILLLLLVIGAVGTTLVLLTQHEPSFYARAGVVAGPQRFDLAQQCQGRLIGLQSSITNGGSPENGSWGARFSEAEINSFFEEHFLSSGLAKKYLPDGVSEPRIALEQDRIRLGFRYTNLFFSSIIVIDMRIWLAQGEPNVIVLEFQGLHAGALPISARSLLEDMADSLKRQNLHVAWYRNEGKPAVALRFQSDEPRPSSQLRQLETKPGMLTIVGQSTEFQGGGGGN